MSIKTLEKLYQTNNVNPMSPTEFARIYSNIVNNYKAYFAIDIYYTEFNDQKIFSHAMIHELNESKSNRISNAIYSPTDYHRFVWNQNEAQALKNHQQVSESKNKNYNPDLNPILKQKIKTIIIYCNKNIVLNADDVLNLNPIQDRSLGFTF